MGDQGNPGSQILVNELLCYVTTYIKRSTTEQIVKAIYRFYDIDEITTAKKLLYDHFPRLGAYPPRKTSLKRTEVEAHSCDIVDSLIELDTSSHNIVFCAKDLNRIPRWDPHETDHLSLLEKISKLEGRINNVESGVSENTVRSLNTEDKLIKLDTRMDACEKTMVTIVAKENDSKESASRPYLDAVLGKAKQPHVQGLIEPVRSFQIKPSCSHSEGNKDATGDDVVKDMGDRMDKSKKLDQTGEWSIPRQQARKEARRQRKIVTGIGGSNRFKGGPPPTRDYFIYRVVKPTTEEAIKDFLQDNEITCDKVKMVSNPEAKYCSFKISVCVNEVDKLLTPDIWPEGVRVRKFFNNANSNNGEPN